MGARRAGWSLLLVVLGCFIAAAANFKLYLKDGSYHIVREYRVEGDRVRYYSVERSEWEEIPLELLDLTRTEAERKQEQEALAKEAKVFTAEEEARRELQRELARVPQTTGVYLVDGDQLRPLKQAESKAVTNKGRSVLKVLTPIPIVAGETFVELDGPRSSQLVSSAQPEFYFRMAYNERFGIFKLTQKKDSRVVQKWNIVPVSNEVFEDQEEVQIFRRQLEDGLFKLWPVDPLEPGEYAVVEYTPGQRNIQVWDFAWYPQGGQPSQSKKPETPSRNKK